MQDVGIYIVEDELIVTEELKGVLNLLGYKILGTADDKKAGLNDILSLKPDILLLDINLKGASKGGVEIAETVKEHYNPIIIFLTAYSDKETIEKVKKTDPDGFLLKPLPKKVWQ